MKKWIALLLAACMLFALIGCAAKTAPASAKPERARVRGVFQAEAGSLGVVTNKT